MSCQNYRVIELTNTNIGAVTANAYMPFGTITRRISKTTGGGVPFNVTNSGADTVQITNKGFYKVNYNASLDASAAGTLTISLVVNGVSVYTSTETVAGTDTVNISLVKEVRVFSNCQSCSDNCPANIQIQLGGINITGGSSVLIIDSCVNG